MNHIPKGSAMPAPTYAGPFAGLPPQTDLSTDTAVFTEAYAVIPASTMRDIVTSFLPACGHCRFCAQGRSNLCDKGATIARGEELENVIS